MEHKKTQHILFTVPYYSQRLDVKDAFWQSRSCGIVALAMAMDYSFILAYRHDDKIYEKWLERDNHPLSSPSLPRRGKEGEVSITSLQYKKSVSRLIEQLIHEGAAMGARDPKHGWIHDGLVALAKKHGFKKSFRKEFPEVRFPTSNVGSPTSDKINVLRYIVVLLICGIPVLASFKNKKGRGGPASTNARSGGHLVLLVGFCHLDVQRPSGVYSKFIEGFYYHDPDARSSESGAFRLISTAQFFKRWKGRIVVVQK